jgi:hypothetical protein
MQMGSSLAVLGFFALWRFFVFAQLCTIGFNFVSVRFLRIRRLFIN